MNGYDGTQVFDHGDDRTQPRIHSGLTDTPCTSATNAVTPSTPSGAEASGSEDKDGDSTGTAGVPAKKKGQKSRRALHVDKFTSTEELLQATDRVMRGRAQVMFQLQDTISRDLIVLVDNKSPYHVRQALTSRVYSKRVENYQQLKANLHGMRTTVNDSPPVFVATIDNKVTDFELHMDAAYTNL